MFMDVASGRRELAADTAAKHKEQERAGNPATAWRGLEGMSTFWGES